MNGKLREEILRYRLEKGYEVLHDAEVLMAYELWNSAVNRLYYACFHVATALLVRSGIEVKSHSGVRQALGFILSGRGLFRVKRRDCSRGCTINGSLAITMISLNTAGQTWKRCMHRPCFSWRLLPR